jgi:hypothetical protein
METPIIRLTISTEIGEGIIVYLISNHPGEQIMIVALSDAGKSLEESH